MMEMDIREINILADSLIDKREQRMNDLMYVLHNSVPLYNLAFFSPKDFPKKTPQLRIRPLTEKEEEEQAISQLKEFYIAMSNVLDD